MPETSGDFNTQKGIEPFPTTTIPRKSDAYNGLKALGLDGVVFVCDHGKERSEKAADLAKARGEEKTSRMQNGMWGFMKDVSYNVETATAKLRDLYSKKFLRVIVDGYSDPEGFLKALKASGVKHEIVTSGEIVKEAETLGGIKHRIYWYSADPYDLM